MPAKHSPIGRPRRRLSPGHAPVSQKLPDKLIEAIAKRPSHFIVEVGLMQEGKKFGFEIYESTDPNRSEHMRRVRQTSGFKTKPLADKSLIEYLGGSTSVLGAVLTTTHLKAVHRKLNEQQHSSSIPLREIMRQVR